MEIFGINASTIITIVVTYGIATSLINLLAAVTKIRESINKAHLGAFDAITGITVLNIWNSLFRDAEYISPLMFWLVAGWCLVIATAGLIISARSLMSCNPR